MRRSIPLVLVALPMMLAGCSAGDHFHDGLTSAIPPSDERPSDEPMVLARANFEKGSYGKAEQHFRAAAEANPKNINAWLGLAATYDRLARFELAEQAYARVDQLGGGDSTAALNNRGYHHLLRGNLGKARSYLTRASQSEPSNPLVQGNLRLLETWKTEAPIPEQRHARH